MVRSADSFLSAAIHAALHNAEKSLSRVPVSGFWSPVASFALLETGNWNPDTAFHGTSCLCASKYFLLRSAQRSVSSIDCRARSRSAGCSVHSSNAMMMSAPSPICASMALSGVKKWDDPSR